MLLEENDKNQKDGLEKQTEDSTEPMETTFEKPTKADIKQLCAEPKQRSLKKKEWSDGSENLIC